MKALLLLEFETFIKKKQYIIPIVYLICSIAYVLYMINAQFSHDNFYIIFFAIQLINVFARREQPMKGVIHLFPINAKTRVNTQYYHSTWTFNFLFSISRNRNHIGCSIYYCVD